jgi:hypothetical protein
MVYPCQARHGDNRWPGYHLSRKILTIHALLRLANSPIWPACYSRLVRRQAREFPPPLEDDDPQRNAARFDQTMRKLLTVSKDELAQREAAYQESRPKKKRTNR